jgi:hypothetical protein
VIEEEQRILIPKAHLFNNLQAKFGNEVEKKRVYTTLGTPRLKIVRPSDDDETFDVNIQSKYRSGVGMLLFLTKYS